MAHDPSPRPRRAPAAPAEDPFPLGLWALWTLAVVAVAARVAWPAIVGDAPLDTLRLVISSGLMGAGGLLVLTVLEIRLAPWRFLD